MTAVIINADDLGIDPGIDRGIIEAHRHGVLTSASLLVTAGSHWPEAAAAAGSGGLPLGLHLSLTLGRAITPAGQIPDLAGSDGTFLNSAARLIRRVSASSPVAAQIRLEFANQIRQARSHGVRLTHLDTHQHVHANPAIFQIVEDLAVEAGVLAIRRLREPIFPFELRHGLLRNVRRRNPLKLALLRWRARANRPRVASNDFFFGLMYSGNLGQRALERFLHAIAASARIWEIGLHPGYPLAGHEQPYAIASVNRFLASPWRRRELELLLDPGIRALVSRLGIELISHADVPDRLRVRSDGCSHD